MTDFMSHAYVFVWAALAVLSLILGIKHEKVFFIFSGFFVFMSVWQALKAFWGLPVTEGALGWVFRGVMVVFLGVAVFFWLRSRRERKKSEKDSADKKNF